MTSDTLKADLLILLVTFLAAIGWMISKQVLDLGMPPLLFMGGRFLLAGLILGVGGWAAMRRLSRQQVLKASAVGVNMALAFYLWVSGLYVATHIGEGSFIISLGVIFIPLIGFLFFGERPSLSTWLSLPIAMIGLALLALDNGFVFEQGQLLFLLAAALFALHFNFNTRTVAKVPAIALSSIQLIVAGALGLLVSAWLEEWPQFYSLELLGLVLASALFATSARFYIQTYAQSLAPASHVGVILTVEPIWVATLAFLFFGETMSTLQLLGCSIIFTALLITRWRFIHMMLRGQTA